METSFMLRRACSYNDGDSPSHSTSTLNCDVTSIEIPPCVVSRRVPLAEKTRS